MSAVSRMMTQRTPIRILNVTTVWRLYDRDSNQEKYRQGIY